MTPPTVLLLHHENGIGGAEWSLVDMVNFMPEEIDIIVALPVEKRGDPPTITTQIGKEILPADFLRPLSRSLQTCLLLSKGAIALRRTVERISPSIIHANTITTAVYAIAAGLHRRYPIVCHLRDNPPKWNTPTGRMNHALLGLLRRRTERLIPISHAVAKAFCIDEGDVIHPGVDFSRTVPSKEESESLRNRFRKEHGIPDGAVLIGMCAAMVPWKNHLVAVEAVEIVRQEVPDTFLVIAGGARNEKEERYMHHLCNTLQEKGTYIYTRLCGWLTNMKAFYAAIDILVHPVSCEPFGRTVAEAIVSGKPVIAFDGGGGPSEIIRSAGNGTILKDHTAAALAKAIKKNIACGHPPEQDMETAAERIKRLFDPSRQSAEIADLYRKILTRRG